MTSTVQGTRSVELVAVEESGDLVRWVARTEGTAVFEGRHDARELHARALEELEEGIILRNLDGEAGRMALVLISTTALQLVAELPSRQGTERQVVIDDLAESHEEVGDVRVWLTDVLMQDEADPPGRRQRRSIIRDPRYSDACADAGRTTRGLVRRQMEGRRRRRALDWEKQSTSRNRHSALLLSDEEKRSRERESASLSVAIQEKEV